MFIPVFEDILTAAGAIRPHIHHTPVLTSRQMNALSGGRLFFKCENFQKVGAFKYRGATNAVINLTDEQRRRGVVTHSSGNHAAALAHAAVSRGVKAYIVMPVTSSEVKKAAVAGYGATITLCAPTLKAREAAAAEIISTTGATLIHPYDNLHIIAGQGTAALELLTEVPSLDAIVAPVGGGGLISGTALTARQMNPAMKIYGAEPQLADDACRSLRTGQIQPPMKPLSVADGLLTALCERTFNIIKDNVDDIITVSEESIIRAMLLVWERMKIIIEPSSATAVAAVLDNKKLFAGKKTGIILSGGNVDFRHLPFQSTRLK